MRGQNRTPNLPERKLIRIIQANHLPFKYVGDGSVIICGLNPDFVECNGQKKIIELFGDYWHGKGADSWKDTEWGRKAVFSQVDFDTLIIWEHELDSKEETVRRIKEFANG